MSQIHRYGMQSILVGILAYLVMVFLLRGCPTMSIMNCAFVAGGVFIILYLVDKPLPLPI